MNTFPHDPHFIMEDAMALSFTELRRANVARQPEFRNAKGKVISPNGLADWPVVNYTNAMAGEAGEACNVATKINRGDFTADDGTIEDRAKKKLADELADTIIYADLAAARAGIDLGKAIREKFNETSVKVGSEVML